MLSLTQVLLATLGFSVLFGGFGIWAAVTSRSEARKDQ